jgi:hypothetical protein
MPWIFTFLGTLLILETKVLKINLSEKNTTSFNDPYIKSKLVYLNTYLALTLNKTYLIF